PNLLEPEADDKSAESAVTVFLREHDALDGIFLDWPQAELLSELKKLLSKLPQVLWAVVEERTKKDLTIQRLVHCCPADLSPFPKTTTSNARPEDELVVHCKHHLRRQAEARRRKILL